jgi:PAS domain S-box-containing protein
VVSAIRDKEGKPVLFVAELEDITIRKEQERAEKTKSDEIQGIVDGIGDFLFVIDKNRVITKVNKPICDILKKTPEELIGRHCYEIMHNADASWCNCPASKTLLTKQIVTEEVDDPNLGIPLLVTTSPILDEAGEVAQIIHIAKDITKIKQAEMEMHIAANLFGATSDSIIVHELDGKLVYFNEAAYTTRGYTRDEFQALSIRDLEVPDDPRFFGTRLNELLELGEVTFEAHNLCKDKTVLPVEIHAQVIESDGRKLVLSVARDISERKAAEEKLVESQEKYETSFESSMDALMLLDEKSFLDCNAETLRIFGFNSVNEFSKKHPADLSPESQPDGSSSFVSANNHIKKALWSGRDNFFWVHKRADGTTFPADVLFSRINLKNRVILQATVRDITDQKEAEEKLRESGRRIEMMNEKLRVVGSLTRHDVRNKLSAVTGYAYILKKKHGDLADVVNGLNKMEQAVMETVKIFDFAKMYEQIGVEELTYVNVEEKLMEAVTLFSGPIPTIKNECQGLTVLADSFLRQLFYNFLDNTRKYGKKTTIIRVHYEKMDEDSLKLVYEDDGEGVSFENKPSLFKEGFSTGGSTGFGLFLIKRMIDVYGWRIDENGEPGKGAKFTITIPKLNKNGEENYQVEV